MPEGNERYLYPTRCEDILGPCACRSARKWNRRQSLKGRFCSTVCWTWAFLGVYTQNIRRNIKRWMENQHLVLWCGPCSKQRQAWGLICGPKQAIRTWLLLFNRTQFRVVLGLLTGYNTMWRHLYVMGLSSNPTCRKCGTEEETSINILCKCQAFVLLRHTHLGPFFWTLRISGNLV